MEFLRKNGISAVCVWVMAAFLVVFSVINFFGFEQFCTPDMYSDTYLARLMWQEKTLFPDSWVFGNQFYVFVTPVVASVFYGLCGSLNLAMALATTTMTVLMLLSFWWMVKPFASREQIMLGMAVLLGCVIGPRIETTIEGQIFYIMASYYSGYLIALFVVFGDHARALCGKEHGWMSLAVSMVLSFCTGMQSLRQTAVMILPLLGLETLRVLGHLIREKKLLLDAPVLRALAYAGANILGMVYIRVLDPNRMTMYGELALNPLQQYPKRIETGFAALRSITGLKYLWSETPVLGVVACVLVAVVILGLVAALAGRSREGLEVLSVFFGFSVLSVIAVSIVVNIYTRSIYLFPWYGLPAVAAMVLLGRWKGWRKLLLCTVLICALVSNLTLSYLPTAQEALEDPQTQDRMIAEYLMEEGYTRVYGVWGRVYQIAAWTDGRVSAGAWFEGVCRILPYINPMDVYSDEDLGDAAYLVTSGEQEAFLKRAEALGAQVTLETSFEGGYLLYTSDVQLMYHDT